MHCPESYLFHYKKTLMYQQ